MTALVRSSRDSYGTRATIGRDLTDDRANCPACRRCTQLEAEAVPPGYPPIHGFLPDLEGFYMQWPGRELPV